MQWKQYLYQKPLQVLYLVFALLIIKELIIISTLNGKVSSIGDGYSEANAIRGATSFLDIGISQNYGLPNICYGNILSDVGSLPEHNIKGISCPEAYTHYPPGPEYLLWVGLKVFGRDNWNLVRLCPLLLSALIGLYFIRSNFAIVGGGAKGLAFGLMLLLPPMYSNYMHGLHYQQYGFLLLQLQIILSLKYVRSPNWKYLIAFLFLGFFQGWLSFDYAFLTTFFFLPFFLHFSKETSLKFSDFLKVSFASGFGFTLAHALHFLQVVNYFGSFDTAVDDFRSSAANRAYNAHSENTPANQKFENVGLFTVMKDYLYRVAGRGKYLAINLINFIWIIFALRFIRKIETKRFKFTFEVSTRDILSLGAAVLVSALWSLVMRQHAHVHGFIARHYYFCYFFCCLIVVRRTLVRKKNEPLTVT